MPEYIDEKIVKARKEHICDYCTEKILSGTKYSDFVGKEDGRLYHFKSHLRCKFIANQLYEYIDPWDGLGHDEFVEGCNNFTKEFLCKKCKRFSKRYNECKDDNSPYIDCLDKIGQTLLKYDFIAEKRFPNRPISRFWNPWRRYLKPKKEPLTCYPGEEE